MQVRDLSTKSLLRAAEFKAESYTKTSSTSNERAIMSLPALRVDFQKESLRFASAAFLARQSGGQDPRGIDDKQVAGLEEVSELWHTVFSLDLALATRETEEPGSVAPLRWLLGDLLGREIEIVIRQIGKYFRERHAA